MIHIYDGINVVRRGLHTDPSGRYVRKAVTDMYAVSAPHVHVWVWDGAGGNDRRRQIYPDYKMGRKPQGDDVWATIDLLMQTLIHTPAIQVKVNGYEADDVIADLAKRYPDCYIHSSDQDFAQLGVKGDFKRKVPAELVRLYKTFVGDPRDNIPGVPKFGQKTWDDADKDHLAAIMDGAEPVGFRPGIINWLNEPANIKTLKMYWDIIGFIPIEPDLIDRNTTAGVADRVKMNELLSRYML